MLSSAWCQGPLTLRASGPPHSLSGPARLQAALHQALEDLYQHTMASSHMQPYMCAPEKLRTCTCPDPQRWLLNDCTARQLASNVDSLGSWLAQLSSTGHHISSAYVRSIAGSGNGGCRSGQGPQPGHGLLDVDVSSVRPVLVEAGKIGFG